MTTRANVAHKAKEAAEAVIVKAKATKEAAKDVSNKLNALDMNTVLGLVGGKRPIYLNVS